MPLTRIYLIRHADVENPRNVLYGHLDGFGLSQKGRLQAEAVGRSLRRAELVRIVHSPLQRAVETATIIAAQLEPRPELVPDPDLREAEFSRHLQGVPYWQIPIRRPRWYIHKFRRGFLSDDEPYSVLGGRVLDLARRMVRDHPGDTTALISHADPLQAAWMLLEGRPQTEREMHRRTMAKAAMLLIDFHDLEAISWKYYGPPAVRTVPVA